MLQKAEDVADAGNGAFHVGLETLGAIILNPYQGPISVGGGGGSSSQLGWGDETCIPYLHGRVPLWHARLCGSSVSRFQVIPAGGTRFC